MSDQKSQQRNQQGGKQQGQDGKGKQQGQGASPRKGQDSLLQTIATTTSGLILLAATVFLVYEGISPRYPPTFDISRGEIRQTLDRHYVPLRVRNTGDETARAVTVVVTLSRNGQQVAESSATLPWLPSRSEREATVVFSQDPREYDIDFQIQGYVDP